MNAQPVYQGAPGGGLRCSLRAAREIVEEGIETMEMASGCPRRTEITENDMPRRPVRGPHGGWQEQEIRALRERIEQAEQQGESLRCVFDDMGRCLGRKPNSIRNFYYAQLRAGQGETQRALPFETFTPEEIEHLIRSVLIARAQGKSVRACVRELAGEDRSRMLRYQNKYRSVVRTRPELVRRIMDQLAKEGVAYVSPYPDDGAENAHVRLAQLKTHTQSMSDAKLIQLLDSLSYLIHLAESKTNEPAPLPLSADNADALRRADKLRAQVDLLRIALDDEKKRACRLRSETEGMLTVIREYIALPEEERPKNCAAFCQSAAARLSLVECALMEE